MSNQSYMPSVHREQLSARELVPEVDHYSGQTYFSHSYYRSNLFVTEAASSPLLAAAMPLLCLMSRLQITHYNLDLSYLHQQLMHEINAFSSLVQSLSYPFEVLLTSRYLLSLTFDEWVLRSNHPDKNIWLQQTLVATCPSYPFAEQNNENISHLQNLVKLTERLLQNPEGQQDLLELIYNCLRLGFPEQTVLGFYTGKQTVILCADLMEQLHAYLQTVRPQLTELFTQPLLPPIDDDSYEKPATKIPRVMIYAGAGVIAGLLGCYVLMSYVVHLVAQPLMNQLANYY